MPELTRRVLFREVNAKIRKLHDGLAPGEDDYELLCECGRDGCEERVTVPARLDGGLGVAGRYLVAPGHEQPGLEHVVDRRSTYSVVAAR